MSLRARAALLCAFAAALGGCSLIVGIPDRSDHSPDGSAEASADAPAEGGPGESAIDGPPPGDGSNDAGPTTPFCDSVEAGYVLCDSFDDGGLGNYTANPPLLADAGSITVDGTRAHSTPDSLHVAIDAVPGGDDTKMLTWAEADLPGSSYATVDLDFWLYVDAFPTNQPTLYVVEIDTDASKCNGVLLYLDSGDAVLQQRTNCSSFGSDIHLNPFLAAQTWNHVEIRLSLSPPGQAPIVRFNGVDAVPGGSTLVSQITAGPIAVKLGTTVLNSPADTLEEHYDDVVVRAQ